MKTVVDIKRIEIVVTKACSGKCKHCSAKLEERGGSVNADAVTRAIKQLTSRYNVETIMTFGGEPLLFSDTVCKIHETARECGIAGRAVITNGFFSHDNDKVESVAASLCASGVDNVYLSVDAFHQEYIPIEPVVCFAEALVKHGVKRLRIHPAWVVNRQHQNHY